MVNNPSSSPANSTLSHPDSSLVDLSTSLGSLKMKNPFTVASGTFASGKEYASLWAQTLMDTTEDQFAASLHAYGFDANKPLAILGAATTKGVSFEPWKGNEGVRITETASGMLNSIGLQNPGVEEFCRKDIVWLQTQDVPIIVNVSGHSINEYCQVIERLEQEESVSAYEINVSCPNVDSGGMVFGTDAHAALNVTRACRKATRRPLIIKLSPNVTDITQIAKACEDGGADALSLINTVAGMAIDIKTRKSIFDRKVAGLSGAAIKPIALYAIHRVYNAVGIPLIGMGGITSAQDAFEFMLAGASAISIGSHNFIDPLAVPRMLLDFTKLCNSEGINDTAQIIGKLN